MKIFAEGPPNAVGKISLDFSHTKMAAKGFVTVQDLFQQIEQKTEIPYSRLRLHSYAEQDSEEEFLDLSTSEDETIDLHLDSLGITEGCVVRVFVLLAML